MLIQEADELLYSYSAGAEGASYVLQITDDTLKASEFMDSLNKEYIDIRIQEKESFEPALRDNNAIDFFDLFTKTEIIKMLPEGITYNLYKYRLIRPFDYAVKPLIKKIKQLSNVDKDMLFCMSDPDNGNFRNKKAIRKPYKGNRRVCLSHTPFNGVNYLCLNSAKAVFANVSTLESLDKVVFCECKTHGSIEEGSRKPYHYSELKQWLIDNHNTKFMYGLEADDGLGMLFSAPDKTMSHIDKDINQLPGKHLNWQTMEKYTITKEQGLDFFLEQCLTGDGTDNIPSCLAMTKKGVGKSGYGKAKALKLLGACDSIGDKIKAVKGAYMDAYGESLGMEYMIECSDLVGMGKSESVDGTNIKPGSAQLLELILKYT